MEAPFGARSTIAKEGKGYKLSWKVGSSSYEGAGTFNDETS